MGLLSVVQHVLIMGITVWLVKQSFEEDAALHVSEGSVTDSTPVNIPSHDVPQCLEPISL